MTLQVTGEKDRPSPIKTELYITKTFNYWVREGFGVKPITERYHTDTLNIKLDL